MTIKQENLIAFANKRALYLMNILTHREYYASIAKMAGVVIPVDNYLVIACKNGRDQKNYNDTGLTLGAFVMRNNAIEQAFKAHGDFWSQAGSVCLTKEAIRQAIEKNDIVLQDGQIDENNPAHPMHY